MGASHGYSLEYNKDIERAMSQQGHGFGFDPKLGAYAPGDAAGLEVEVKSSLTFSHGKSSSKMNKDFRFSEFTKGSMMPAGDT